MRKQNISVDRLMIPNQATLNKKWGSHQQRYWGLITGIGIEMAILKFQKGQLTSIQEIYGFLANVRKLAASILNHTPSCGVKRDYFTADIVSREERNSFKEQVDTFEMLYNERESTSIPVSCSGYQTPKLDCLFTQVYKDGKKNPSYIIKHHLPSKENQEAIFQYANNVLSYSDNVTDVENAHKDIVYIINIFSQWMQFCRGSAAITHMFYHVLEFIFFGKFTYFNYQPDGLIYDLAAMVAKNFDRFYAYFNSDILDDSFIVETLDPEKLKKEFDLNLISSDTLKMQIAQILRELKNFRAAEYGYFSLRPLLKELEAIIASWEFMLKLANESDKDDLVFIQSLMKIFMMKFSEHKIFYPMFAWRCHDLPSFWAVSETPCVQYKLDEFKWFITMGAMIYTPLSQSIKFMKIFDHDLIESGLSYTAIMKALGNLSSIVSRAMRNDESESVMINAMQYYIERTEGDSFYRFVNGILNMMKKIPPERTSFPDRDELLAILEKPDFVWVEQSGMERLEIFYEEIEKFFENVEWRRFKNNFEHYETLWGILFGKIVYVDVAAEMRKNNQPSITTVSLLNTQRSCTTASKNKDAQEASDPSFLQK